MNVGHDEGLQFNIQILNNLGFETNRNKFIDQIKCTNTVVIINTQAKKFLILSLRFEDSCLRIYVCSSLVLLIGVSLTFLTFYAWQYCTLCPISEADNLTN